jgi:hypothetical protein
MIELVLLSLGLAGATWFGGWWALAVIAALWGLLRPGPPGRAGLAAVLAWAAILVGTIPLAPLARLVPRMGGLFGLPGWAALLLTLLYAGLLGWSAARLARGIRYFPTFMAKLTSAPDGSRTVNSSIP